MTALAVLLSDGNGRGSGDLHSKDSIIGSWARDRIVIAGDYADPEPDSDGSTIYSIAGDTFEDISEKIIEVLVDAGEDIRYE